ncbi:lipid-A-disaccharide synthase, partial [Arenicella sp.]|nr:lipid-A-disaccharide synthase [Arenicella sp.]
MKIAIVAGEKSGDYLGAELIKAIKARHPQAEFVGLCGALMQGQGASSLAEMEKISIFGLDGLFSSLREIIAIRKNLYRHFIAWQPDLFIGIDVPDFNLTLAGKLKRRGIPTVHYVSPTVWAWRGGRIKKIRRCIDLMLTLFPFEKTYYQQNNMSVEYVGHPLAKQIMRWQIDQTVVSRLALDDPANTDKKLLAILPGSRMSEVSRLAPMMLDGATELSKQFANLKFVIPAANKKIFDYISELPNYDANLIELIEGSSRDVLALSYLVVLASGTAALEAALFAKPMVVMYRVSKLSAFVYKNSITVEHYSMPNHLAEKPIVPELIQDDASTDNLVAEVSKLLNN